MRPLDDHERRLLFRVSALFCSLSLMLAPIAAQSSAPVARDVPGSTQIPGTLRLWPVHHISAIPLRRDPFRADRAESPLAAAQSPQAASIVGLRVVQGQSIGYTVPGSNLAVLRAIVSGNDGARALVEIAGRTQILAPGDRIGTARVVRIDSGGVTMSDGAHLRVEAASQ